MKRLWAVFALVCYLGIHNGHLALWDDGKEDPLMVFPYRVSLYPKADQKALEQGIPYASQEELSALLEDFLS